jgi:hypothetical protein
MHGHSMASPSLRCRFCNCPMLDASDWDTHVTSPQSLTWVPHTVLSAISPHHHCHGCCYPNAAATALPWLLLPQPRHTTTTIQMPPLLSRCCCSTIAFTALMLPPLPCCPYCHYSCPNTTIMAPPCSPALTIYLWVGPGQP